MSGKEHPSTRERRMLGDALRPLLPEGWAVEQFEDSRPGWRGIGELRAICPHGLAARVHRRKERGRGWHEREAAAWVPDLLKRCAASERPKARSPLELMIDRACGVGR